MPNKSPLLTNLQLWQCQVGEHTIEVEEATRRQLSESENIRFSSTSSRTKKREYLLSRALIRKALSELYSLPTSHWQLSENSKAAPSIGNLPGQLFYSLSHSKGYICFVTAKCPVGVDIEKITHKTKLIQLAELFMSEDELSFLKSSSTQQNLVYFYQIWCAKEAYFKAISIEQQRQLIFSKLSVLSSLQKNGGWNFLDKSNDEYCLKIAINNMNKCINLHTQSFFA